jgi:hypothetical protein
MAWGKKAKGGDAPRVFKTGASRNNDTGKLDFDGFFSPLALEAQAEYMNYHRSLEDGSTRDSDNWQKGIPLDAYRKSAWRHFMDVWKFGRGMPIKENFVFAACGLLFNINGWLHVYLKENPDAVENAVAEMRKRRGY